MFFQMPSVIRRHAEKLAISGANNIILARTRRERGYTLAVRSHAVQVIVRINRYQVLVFTKLTLALYFLNIEKLVGVAPGIEGCESKNFLQGVGDVAVILDEVIYVTCDVFNFNAAVVGFYFLRNEGVLLELALQRAEAVERLARSLSERGRRIYLETHGLHVEALERCLSVFGPPAG